MNSIAERLDDAETVAVYFASVDLAAHGYSLLVAREDADSTPDSAVNPLPNIAG